MPRPVTIPAAVPGEAVGRAVRALSGVIAYDKGLEGLHEQLMTIDSLLNDFNRELQDYADAVTFGQEDFYTVEERLNLINHLKDKYGSTIEKTSPIARRRNLIWKNWHPMRHTGRS